MVKLVTGTVPFRFFWMHSAELMKVKQQLGASTVYGGYMTQELDFNREKKLKHHDVGGIGLVSTAVPREAVIEREFVKHKMMIDANAHRIYEFLDSQDGQIYVCGDFSVANDAKSVVASIFQEYENVNLDEAPWAV